MKSRFRNRVKLTVTRFADHNSNTEHVSCDRNFPNQESIAVKGLERIASLLENNAIPYLPKAESEAVRACIRSLLDNHPKSASDSLNSEYKPNKESQPKFESTVPPRPLPTVSDSETR